METVRNVSVKQKVQNKCMLLVKINKTRRVKRLAVWSIRRKNPNCPKTRCFCGPNNLRYRCISLLWARRQTPRARSTVFHGTKRGRRMRRYRKLRPGSSGFPLRVKTGLLPDFNGLGATFDSCTNSIGVAASKYEV